MDTAIKITTAIIILAIIAVLVSKKAATADFIRSVSSFYGAAVKNTVAPVTLQWAPAPAWVPNMTLNPLKWLGFQ